jgi:hypothetical protein
LRTLRGAWLSIPPPAAEWLPEKVLLAIFNRVPL